MHFIMNINHFWNSVHYTLRGSKQVVVQKIDPNGRNSVYEGEFDRNKRPLSAFSNTNQAKF